MELSERPDHPFVLFNLGMTYADMEQPERAINFLKRCLLVSSADESHVRKAYALLVGCLTQINGDEEARRILVRGRQLYPDDPELLFRLGILEQRAKNYPCAIAAYEDAIQVRGTRYFASRDWGISGHKARHNLAGIYCELGRFDLAELQWRIALSQQPNYREGWRGLVEVLLRQRKEVALEVEIEAKRECGFATDELACASARLAIARGQIDNAIEFLDTAIERDESAIEPLRLKCQLLFEYSTPDRAVAALINLCRHTPNDGAAWHNLGMAYQRAGCVTSAVTCFEKSLSIRPDSVQTRVQLDSAQDTLTRMDSSRGDWHAAQKRAPQAADESRAVLAQMITS
jgi:tetratricopeptide (TPR) repeat protein